MNPINTVPDTLLHALRELIQQSRHIVEFEQGGQASR